ncbi:hypothetical protein CsSME_00008608 [Camellia sinensis var. sinensis]
MDKSWIDSKVPPNILLDQWREVMAYWSSKEANEFCGPAHRTGRTFFANLRKKGEYNEQLSRIPGPLQTNDALEKIFHAMVGTDGHGYCKTYGTCITRSVVDPKEVGPSQASSSLTVEKITQQVVYPAKMSSSSIGGEEGQMLRFMSKKCRCGRKAAIRIVEFEKPSKVGYAPIYGRDEIDDEKPRVEEGVQFNGKLMKLGMKMEALTMMMKTSMVVLLVCFISTMLMFSMK